MTECAGNKFILNGELQQAEMFDNSMVYEGESLYEVLRLVKGCPVFFDDHMERLKCSVKLQKKTFLSDITDLKKAIITLARIEKKRDTNLKIVFNYKDSGNNSLIYFIDTVYPTPAQYSKGVKGILYSGERKDPEAKVINHKLRSSIAHKLISEGAYEAILVNEKNLITEGSRSNIFFIKNETLITAPDNVILNGITRKYILEICRERNIKVAFECVDSQALKIYDAAFMTGTSPMVLPFSSIGDVFFDAKHPMTGLLRTLYLQKSEASMSQFISK